jgi:hypothetical protein
MESVSREPTLNPEENMYFQERWARYLSNDAYYNNRFLELSPPNFNIKFNKRQL